jgi:acyl-CoA synthetase (AMP-forming)/AMP-acid ligase II
MIFGYLQSKMQKNLDSLIYDETNVISYGGLLKYAETFGENLRKYDCRKFGILCRSELNSAKALMACFYVRKTVVMLSHRYGEKHNRNIIETAGLTHIITDNGIEIMSGSNTKLKANDSEILSDTPLIMYTSGTTGNPKGTMLTHENLITNLKDIEAYFKIRKGQKILIARPLYHCAVLTGEFFISLVKGLDIIFNNNGFNPADILRAVRQNDISVLCGTPSMLYHISSAAKKTTQPLPIKTVAVSGECMTAKTAELMRSALPSADIYHVYGLTEASPRVSYLPPELFDKHPLSVGLPLNSLKAKIKDGELLVKGGSVMKGYYNDTEATKKVIKNGWLHTGDIAEIDESGMITIKSRKDDMIIRAGINIYPQEIENALKKDERITEAVVCGINNETAGQKICLRAVAGNLSKSEIFNICKKLLPLYQLPDIIEVVDAVPKNASGKVIRRKL